MEHLLKPLKNIIEYQIFDDQFPCVDVPEINKLAKEECNRFKSAVIKVLVSAPNPFTKSSLYNFYVGQLTVWCDQLFVNERTGLMEHTTSKIILDLILNLKTTSPKLLDGNTPVPLLFRKLRAPGLSSQWDELLHRWVNAEIDPELIQIARQPIEDFISSQEVVCWNDHTWLDKYLDGLKKLDVNVCIGRSRIESLICEYLIRMNYNNLDFIQYCHKLLQQHIQSFAAKNEQLYVLQLAKKNIGQLSTIVRRPRYQDASAVKEDLYHWIDLEYRFINRIKMSDAATLGPVNALKFVYNMKAEQLAFWHKLQWDNGVYKRDKLDDLCEKIAYNCGTERHEKLSPGSLKSKFYGKDPRVIEPIYRLLLQMLQEVSYLRPNGIQ